MEFKAVGLRLPQDMLNELKKVEDEQSLDRSTVARQMLLRGLQSYNQDLAVQKYASGRMTISEASDLAGMTIWEFEALLVREGHASNYSLDDLSQDLKTLAKS